MAKQERENSTEIPLNLLNMRGAKRFHMNGLTQTDSARAIIEAARALRMPAGDVAAGVGHIAKEIKVVPPLRS